MVQLSVSGMEELGVVMHKKTKEWRHRCVRARRVGARTGVATHSHDGGAACDGGTGGCLSKL
jgi:hypothetical protein